MYLGRFNKFQCDRCQKIVFDTGPKLPKGWIFIPSSVITGGHVTHRCDECEAKRKSKNDYEMQISLQGKTEVRDGVKVVTEVTKIISCDIVQKEN